MLPPGFGSLLASLLSGGSAENSFISNPSLVGKPSLGGKSNGISDINFLEQHLLIRMGPHFKTAKYIKTQITTVETDGNKPFTNDGSLSLNRFLCSMASISFLYLVSTGHLYQIYELWK